MVEYILMVEDKICIEGTLSRVTFHAKDTGYGIFRVLSSESEHRGSVTVTGTLMNPVKGGQVRVVGSWVTHAKYGRQLKADSIEEVLPKTEQGIIAFLSSGLIKGIGPKTAEKIVHTFGDHTLQILESNPQQLRKISGFSEKKVKLVLEGWHKYQAIREVMMFLQSYGISPAFAARIYKHYGQKCVDILKENPYQLADDVWGIGFKSADQIAMHMSIERDHPKRLACGLKYILETEANSGHTWMLYEELCKKTAQLLEVPPQLLEDALVTSISEGHVYEIKGGSGIALRKYYLVEQSLYLKLKNHKEGTLTPQWQTLCEKWIRAYHVKKLTDEQREAILTLSKSPMGVLTGGPGCGKTTSLKALVQLYRDHGKRVLCCAPTGRAARRMEEVIGIEASTIHRLLEYDPKNGTFVRNCDFPLSGDCLIVDETSMVDVELAMGLLQAVPSRMQVIWVGDQDQLPSVGPGRFLADVIYLDMCPVAQLTEIFRQGDRSTIVQSAHRVNQGEFPLLKPPDGESDFYFVERKTPEGVQSTLVNLVEKQIPEKFKIKSSDIKVLTPMHRGGIGTIALNTLLQERLNPNVTEGKYGIRIPVGHKVHEGDVVLQKVNNYTLNLMNGEVGIVKSITDDGVVICFDGKDVICDPSDLQDMDLGYAMSIHKSQGSEFPAVVLPIHESHYIMLHRTLLYTAITRARQLCILIGSKRAIAMAIGKQSAADRRTLLPVFHEENNH